MVFRYRFAVLGVVALALVAIGIDLAEPSHPGLTPAPSTAGSSGGLTEAPVAVHAESIDGDFVLTFDVPRTTWSTTDSITGTARLAYGGTGHRTLYGSGSGLIGFTFQEVGGTKHGDWLWHADCGQHAISVDAPLIKLLQKGAIWSADDPNASFYAAFVADLGYHFPVGDWQLTALALFDERPCTGEPAPSGAPGPHDMRADLLVHVVP